MSFFKCKKIKSIIIIFLTVSFFTSNLLLAWAPQVQSNYLKEAIRILPWFQYLMCKDYQINNCLKPPYLHTTKPTKEEIYYHNQCTRLANNTESIELKTENIDNIENLKSWLEEMLTKNLKLRDEWYKEASIDKSNYKKYTMLASENNIYNLAGIINYVLGDLNPMTPEMKKFVYDKINKKFKGMRKPGI